MKDISIIVPVYNVDKWLERCVVSLIRQTIFTKLEIILVDDGSTDTSGVMCDEYSSQYDNIVTVHKSNGGVSSARNYGLDYASGKYIAFVDADDYTEPWFYEKMLENIETEDADLLVMDYNLTYDNGRTKTYRNPNKKSETWNNFDAIKEFLKGGLIGVNLFDKLFKREKISKIYFDENIKIGEDLYFIFLYLLGVDKVYGDFKAGYNYYQREGSAMNNTFSEKYFDVMTVSKLIQKYISREYKELNDYADALYIHSAYKTLERAYKADAYEKYKSRLMELTYNVSKYPILKAKKYLSFKQFVGFILIKISPKLYIKVCKMLGI